MTEKLGKITENTFYLTVAYIFQKILAFIYFALLARFLGASQVGQYVFALSFTTIFSVFIDFGLSPVLTREIAKNKEKASNYLSNVVSLKIFFSLIIYFLVFVLINLLNYPFTTRLLVYLAGLVMVLDSFTLSFYAVLRGFQTLKYEAIGTMVYQIIVVSLGGIFLLLKFPLFSFILVIVSASLFNFLFSFFILYKNKKVKIYFSLNKKIISFLFKIALPFAIAGIFIRIYSYIDSVLLSKLAGSTAVGLYSVAYKLTFAFQFIPAAFGASIFPAFSYFYAYSKEKLQQTFEKAVRYLVMLALPLTGGIFVLADKFILTLYGQEYFPSIIPLRILICVLIFVFLNYPLGSILNACDKQGINTRNIGLAMVINVVLNFVLIPRYSFIGSSIAALVSYSFLTFISIFYVTKTISYDKIGLIKYFLKCLLATLIISFLIFSLKKYISFILLIIPAIAIYFSLLYLFKAIRKEDIYFLKRVFRK